MCIKTISIELRTSEIRESLLRQKGETDSPLFNQIHIVQCCISFQSEHSSWMRNARETVDPQQFKQYGRSCTLEQREFAILERENFCQSLITLPRIYANHCSLIHSSAANSSARLYPDRVNLDEFDRRGFTRRLALPAIPRHHLSRVTRRVTSCDDALFSCIIDNNLKLDSPNFYVIDDEVSLFCFSTILFS